MSIPRYQEAFACPRCRTGLSFARSGATCPSCSSHYGLREGFLDFAPEVTSAASFGQAIMESPMHASIYESTIRPHFLKVMARLWCSEWGHLDECDYICRFLDPVEGPVLDLACGTGRWTRTIADKVGRHRTIGLDLSLPMLKVSQKACPRLRFVRGTGQALPFKDGVLGAVNCWAALQLVPDPKAALDEVGRCLGAGGTFTCFTFRRSPDPIYRYFQEAHAPGLPLFTDQQISTWTQESGMEMVDIGGPELALLFTARRR